MFINTFNAMIENKNYFIEKWAVIALWMLLIASFCFAVYKNFTAINIKTVHETKVIDKEIVDTHKIENFVKNFA